MLTPSLLSRPVLADLRRGPVVALVLTCLTGLVVCLAGASVLLIGRTMAATDQLWQAGMPPDVVQMSTGPISAQETAAIHDWAAQREDVAEARISRTLPVPVSALSINGTSQATSVLEPAFVTQNPSFDLLVGEDGQVLQPGPGEIALPVHYLVTGQARIGDTVEGADVADLAAQLRHDYPGAKVTVPEDFGAQTVGSTTTQMRSLVLAACVAGLAVVLLVTVLSTVLHLERSRADLTALASLGMDSTALLRLQLVRAAVLAASGIVVGQILAAAGGQGLLGAALSQMGAPGIRLITNPALAWGMVSAGLIAIVLAGTLIASRSLYNRSLTGQNS